MEPKDQHRALIMPHRNPRSIQVVDGMSTTEGYASGRTPTRTDEYDRRCSISEMKADYNRGRMWIRSVVGWFRISELSGRALGCGRDATLRPPSRCVAT